jgi:hypothetical protein
MQEFQYIQDILKEYYAPVIVNQIYKKTPWWAQIKKVTKGVYGKRVYIPVQTAFTEAVGARVANNYTLPSAQRNTYDAAYIYMKRNYGRIKIDGFSIASAKGKGGWVDMVSQETKGASNAFAIDLDRQSLGRGDAVIGHVAATDGSTITVDNPFGITEASTARLFREGMVIDGYDAGDASKYVDGLTINSIAGNVLTMSASTGIGDLADGDLLVREDTYSSTAANIGEIMGLDGIIDTANTPGSDFQGIDRSSETSWQSHVETSFGALTETKIQEVLDAVEQRTDGETPSMILTTYAIRNKLIDLIRSDRQVQRMNFNAGWKGIKYTGGNVDLPVMVHKNCPTGYMYFPSMPHIKFYALKKLVWDNKGGGILKPVAGEDSYESWFKLYGNIGTDCSNAHAKATGVTTA